MSDDRISFVDLMHDGGPIMWILLAASILSLAVALERAISLQRARHRDRRTAAALRAALGSRQATVAVRHVCSTAGGPLARVLEASLQSLREGEADLRTPLEAAANFEVRRLRRGLSLLATIANLAPLLGFFGTVTGMMLAFDAFAGFGLQSPGQVAEGIKEALTTTAAGLAVAIPAQLAYNLLLSQIENISGRMEAVGELLLRRLAIERATAP